MANTQHFYWKNNILGGGPAIITSNLIFHLDFSNTSCYPGTGTQVSSLVGSYTGTMESGVTFSTNNGGIMVFDGNRSAIDFGTVLATDPMSCANGPHTWEFWLYMNDPPFANEQIRLFCKETSHNQGGYAVALGSTNFYNKRASIIANGGLAINQTPGAYNFNQWVHLAFTLGSSGRYVYTNGVQHLSNTNTNNPFIGTHSKLLLGKSEHRNDRALTGNVAQVRVYDTQLNASEVLQNYNATQSNF